jgi:hypothetical protein
MLKLPDYTGLFGKRHPAQAGLVYVPDDHFRSRDGYEDSCAASNLNITKI